MTSFANTKPQIISRNEFNKSATRKNSVIAFIANLWDALQAIAYADKSQWATYPFIVLILVIDDLSSVQATGNSDCSRRRSDIMLS